MEGVKTSRMGASVGARNDFGNDDDYCMTTRNKFGGFFLIIKKKLGVSTFSTERSELFRVVTMSRFEAQRKKRVCK